MTEHVRVLVTGASGFVGRTLCRMLARAGYVVRAATRTGSPVDGARESVTTHDIADATDWGAALRDVDAVIHAAARAHMLAESGTSSALQAVYDETNAYGTARLAESAARAGVRRFILVSTIKVNGEATGGRPFTAVDEPRPQDAYAISKLRGERAVLDIASRTGMAVAIVRPPLVYGPEVRANFLRLLRWVDQGWPLPLASIRNKRSLVSVWNLADLLSKLLENPLQQGQVWLVSDGQDLSTPELVRAIAAAMKRPPRLLRVPEGVLRSLGALSGRSAEVRRLCDSLVVDISETRSSLGWTPPLTVHESLARTVDWYLGASARASRTA